MKHILGQKLHKKQWDKLAKKTAPVKITQKSIAAGLAIEKKGTITILIIYNHRRTIAPLENRTPRKTNASEWISKL